MARLTTFGSGVLFGTLMFVVGTGYGIVLWLYCISSLRIYAGLFIFLFCLEDRSVDVLGFLEYVPSTCVIVSKEQQHQLVGQVLTYRGMLNVRFNTSVRSLVLKE
jgi:hypothetical protein